MSLKESQPKQLTMKGTTKKHKFDGSNRDENEKTPFKNLAVPQQKNRLKLINLRLGNSRRLKGTPDGCIIR